MKKQFIWIFVFVLIISIVIATDIPPEHEIDYNNPQLDLNNPNVDLNLVDWNVRNQADVPANRIDELLPEVIKIEEISDRTQVTVEQWSFGSNLNKAEDLSDYPHARQAVNQRHPGFTLNLDSGHTSYTDGLLQNGNGPAINLLDPNLQGTSISALTEGGFQIQRGTSSGEFTINNLEFDLSNDDTTTAEIKPNDEIILSSGAQMTDSEGTKVIALDDHTNVDTTEDHISISGVAIVKDKFGNYQKVGDFDSLTSGQFSLDYQDNSYTLEQSSMLIESGSLSLSGDDNVESGILTLIDRDQLNGVSELLVGSLDGSLTETCNARGCSYATHDISAQDLAESISGGSTDDTKFIEDELGIPAEFASTLGVGAMVALQYLPSQLSFNNEDGEFSSVLGYNQQNLNPYFIARLHDTDLQLNFELDGTISTSVQVPFSGDDSFSVNAVITPLEDERVQRVDASFDFNDGGLLRVSYDTEESRSGSLNYHRQIGPVTSSLSVRGSENMQEVMINLDFGRIFE